MWPGTKAQDSGVKANRIKSTSLFDSIKFVFYMVNAMGALVNFNKIDRTHENQS